MSFCGPGLQQVSRLNSQDSSGCVASEKAGRTTTMEPRPNTNISVSGSASPAVIKQPHRIAIKQSRLNAVAFWDRNRHSSLRDEAQESDFYHRRRPELNLNPDRLIVVHKPILWTPQPNPGPVSQARIPAGLCNVPGIWAHARHVGAASSHHNSTPPPPPPCSLPASPSHASPKDPSPQK